MEAVHATQLAGLELFPPGSGVSVVILHAGDELPHLPAAERRLMRRMGPSRRREFSWGRVAARRALAEIGVVASALLPDTDRVPDWPRGIAGSISHSGCICGAAVARGPVSLGLDIETGEMLNRDLWEEVLTQNELAQLSALPAENRPTAALMRFTAKEAVFKAHFPVHRRMFGFLDVEVAPLSKGHFTASLPGPNGPTRTTLSGRWVRDQGLTASGVLMDLPRQKT